MLFSSAFINAKDNLDNVAVLIKRLENYMLCIFSITLI